MNRTVLPVTAFLLLQSQTQSLSSQEAVSRPVQAEIYVMNVDGTDLRNLTNHPAQDEEPEFSPDGARILFDSDRNGNADIFVMNADGTDLVQLTDSRAKEDHGACNLQTEATSLALSPACGRGSFEPFATVDAAGRWTKLVYT